ncbi:MAG: class I SAM-dependent methyltransferase [bacterium]|nr:class I SAM-dependent methyltransferase [bacterium]
MRYFSPEEIKKEKERISLEFSEQKGSPIVVSGKAIAVTLEFLDQEQKILDCGCGNGVFLKSLHDRGFKHLSGADFDEYRKLDFLRDFKTLDFSFNKMPWEDSSFDAVTAWQVMEHLENPHNFIREVARILNPSGLFIFSMPNIQHIFNRIFFLRKGDMYRWRKNNNHIALFPKGIFQKSFLKYFDIVSETYGEGDLPYRFFSRIKFPSNKWFGRDVVYILSKKAD